MYVYIDCSGYACATAVGHILRQLGPAGHRRGTGVCI